MHQTTQTGGFAFDPIGFCVADPLTPFQQFGAIIRGGEDCGDAGEERSSDRTDVVSNAAHLSDAFDRLIIIFLDEVHDSRMLRLSSAA